LQRSLREGKRKGAAKRWRRIIARRQTRRHGQKNISDESSQGGKRIGVAKRILATNRREGASAKARPKEIGDESSQGGKRESVTKEYRRRIVARGQARRRGQKNIGNESSRWGKREGAA
jgi:hypothetical protein